MMVKYMIHTGWRPCPRARRNRRSVPAQSPPGMVGLWDGEDVASYVVNPAGVTHARRLIESRQYVLDSDWGDVQPDAAALNAYLDKHGWDEYAAWHLGLTIGAADATKARYAFICGDLRRVHRTALIACVYRAAQWRHKDIELAAHELLQQLDAATGLRPST
jgi:hypothetical protein